MADKAKASPIPAVQEAVRRLRADIGQGQPWYPALLSAMSRWQIPEETTDGEVRRYLLAGEAFDLVLLAERLLDEVADLVPEDESLAFLFRGRPPRKLPPEEMKSLLGEAKYSQYLNFFYGVTAEEALLEAVEEEVRKEERGLNLRTEAAIIDEAYRRVYGENEDALLEKFRAARAYPAREEVPLGEMKEFTYWLFKYRLEHSDPEKSASDTKKALSWLKRIQPALDTP
jgi:hypothetical protein